MWKYARTKKLKNPEIQSEIHLIIWKALLSTLKKKDISPVSQRLGIKYLRETLRWEISYFLKVEMQLERIKLVPLFIFSAKNKLSKHVSCILWGKKSCETINKKCILQPYKMQLEISWRLRQLLIGREGAARCSSAHCNFDFF